MLNNNTDIKKNVKILIKKSLEENNIKYGNLQIYSSPTRLTLYINDLPNEIKIKAQEIKGPKVGAPENILDSFARAKEVSKKELFEKTFKDLYDDSNENEYDSQILAKILEQFDPYEFDLDIKKNN